MDPEGSADLALPGAVEGEWQARMGLLEGGKHRTRIRFRDLFGSPTEWKGLNDP